VITANMQEVANSLVRRAQRQGWILPSEIREELAHTKIPEAQWKRVMALSRESLHYRHGRYYFQAKASGRLLQERRQKQAIEQTIRRLIRQYRKEHNQHERRQEGRIDFIQPVKVRGEDQREFTLLSRDLSETGIRLISPHSFLGQKLWLELPPTEGNNPPRFAVRILWTCAVGDGLFENGGSFLELVEAEEAEAANNSASS